MAKAQPVDAENIDVPDPETPETENVCCVNCNKVFSSPRGAGAMYCPQCSQ